MKIGEIEFHVLQESLLKFDGGAMFGHVPKVVWQKLAQADERNLVECACNTVLARVEGKWILTDPGMGRKWTKEEQALYAMRSKSYGELLAPINLTPADIDMVIPSHLHIDHAGGLTEWNDEGSVQPVFPNAKVYIQRGEWEAATHPDPRSRPSYREVDFTPLREAGMISFLEGDGEVVPGVSVRLTGGHTKHHQIVTFASGGEKLHFLADIFPSVAHLKPHWVMGYDLYPLQVMEARAALLPELCEKGVYTVFGHDPRSPLGRLTNISGKIGFEPITE